MSCERGQLRVAERRACERRWGARRRNRREGSARRACRRSLHLSAYPTASPTKCSTIPGAEARHGVAIARPTASDAQSADAARDPIQPRQGRPWPSPSIRSTPRTCLPTATPPRSATLVTRADAAHREAAAALPAVGRRPAGSRRRPRLMQIIRRVGSFRGDSSFSTWLFRVTANEALMMMRSQRRHRARLVEGLDLEDLGEPAGRQRRGRSTSAARRQRRRKRARRARSGQRSTSCPTGYRDVVALHYHQDLGLHEIAAAARHDRERRPLAPASRPLAPARDPRARRAGHDIAAA